MENRPSIEELKLFLEEPNEDSYDSLFDQFGGGPNIPNHYLYRLLLKIKDALVKEASHGSDIIPRSPIGKEVRRRCLFDIKWLAHYFLWDAMSLSTFGEIKPIDSNVFLDPQYDAIFDQFFAKDPSKKIYELCPVKTKLILWPRGCAKSWSDHVDTVQWVLAFPHIRILYLTAEASLSTGFVSEVKAFFTMREDEATLMNLFWPEMCCLEKDMKKGAIFTCPEWKRRKIKRKEATITASSVGKTKAGQHYEVIKADDAVSDKNTETETQCMTISQKLDLVENLLVPGGDGHYIFFVGTRYHELDHYGKLADKFQNNGEIEVMREGRNWKHLHNKTFNVDIVIGRACQIKPEVAERLAREGRPVTYVEAGEAGCDILLPNLISYSFFMSKFTKNERVTEGQLNQNPQASSDIEFSRMLMVRATIPYTQMPRQGPVANFWDFAFSKKKGRDYSTGTSVIWGEETILNDDGTPQYDSAPDGRKTPKKKTVGYARRIIRRRFNHLTLAQAVVDLARTERPFVIGIEDAAGSRLLEPTIIAEAVKTGDPFLVDVCSRIDWVTPDNQIDAKRVRIRSLYPWIVEGRFKLLNACMDPDSMDTLYSEFEKCLVSHHHEDIPDSLSYHTRYAPKATQAIVEKSIEMFWRPDQQGWSEVFVEGHQNSGNGFLIQTDGQGNSIYWTPDMVEQIADPMFSPEPDVHSETPHGMPNLLGAGIFG